MSYYYAKDLIEKMQKVDQLVVFGAGDIAHAVLECLLKEPYYFDIEYCMVSYLDGNPKHLNGIPVIDYMAAEKLVSKDALILVATMENYLPSINKGLKEHGYRNIIPLTFHSDSWSLLRGNCYRDDRLLHHKPYLTIEEELKNVLSHKGTRKVEIYTVICHVDQKLEEDINWLPWETPIQAGASLAGQRICDICDNTGEHISFKNRQYSELTALYWIWKNSESDYVGLEHYRRRFELDEEQIKKIACSDIDVVLTIPVMAVPDVESVYRRDHVSTDWDIMLEAVRKLSPDYMDAVKEMQSGKFYYGYNMFIVRREILEDYCTWLFSILSYCEEHCKEKTDSYQNRYIGFLAERLMSAYFLHYENDYKIVHARKHFIF